MWIGLLDPPNGEDHDPEHNPVISLWKASQQRSRKFDQYHDPILWTDLRDQAI